MSAVDMDHLNQWLGRSEERLEVIAPFPANAMAATLDRGDSYGAGDVLPPLWHWLHFLPVHKLSESGRDGHPAKGGLSAAGAAAAPDVGGQPVPLHG
ncbi:MAG: hypothetical protein Q4G24_12515 [Paracoccus sp. (in: a-proteobacteria)]|uniref:hypothetical protein n=1 Tax=Paracoccus sp. TaxID=267 RepID=UPI0026DED927|nr:hypothetical protein [Paracoccus sp. (in: a-proteobacteria)]MDO5622282.1 hypothetical protein [Paracoccus sp. (in: a-proteobacteria)]